MSRPDVHAALLDATRTLVASGRALSGTSVAGEAGVAEATLYRHFPDLGSLAVEAMRGVWPGPEIALGEAARSHDPARRVRTGVTSYLRHLHAHRTALDAIIASAARTRGGPSRTDIRDDLFEFALAPVDTETGQTHAAAVLLRGLRLLTSAGGFFAALDRAGAADDPERVIDEIADAAARLTRTCLRSSHGL